jgi:hypothetical protein
MTTMARRHRLSTHLIRRTARNALRHYEQLQYDATIDSEAGEQARKLLVELGIGLDQPIKVERTTVERGKWRVVAE